MEKVWRLMLQEWRTQDWKMWILVPIPLLLFVGLLHSRLGVSPYAAAIAMMAFFIMQGNLYRQVVRKPGHASARREPDGGSASKREALLAKYAMAFVWFMLAAIVCNFAWTVYRLLWGEDFRLPGPEELTAALAALLAAAGIAFPLQYWLRERSYAAICMLFIAFLHASPDIARAVPDVLIHSPLLSLMAGAAVFALSWWPTYRAAGRRG